MKYSQLNGKLLISRLPKLSERVTNELQKLDFGDDVPHCLFADVLNPVLSDYFAAHDFGGVKTARQKRAALKLAEPLISQIFEFFEDLAASGDEKVRYLLQTSLLEPLYDSEASYKGALLFMGDETRRIFDEIAEYIDIPKGRNNYAR